MMLIRRRWRRDEARRGREAQDRMKRLLLLRHAKSSWDEAGIADHDRPLAPRGERAAALMAAHLAQREASPGLVLCSSARRTRETLERLRLQLVGEPAVCVERELYLADADVLLERVRRVDDRQGSVLLLGHNPGLAELAALLAGSGDADALAHLRRKFPTAALADLCFEVERWRDVAPGLGRLAAFAAPKDLI
jgi:phosphohistidine phosphatase